MSFGGRANLPSKQPKLAGLDATDTSSNEQAVPVRWWIGYGELPLTWIVAKVYNHRTVEQRTKVAKGKEQVTGYKYYGDVAGIAGLGMLRRLRWIESANEIVWQGSITRPDNPAHPDYWCTHVTTPVGDVYVYWGRPDQPVDTHLLAGIGAADASLAHPAYRNQVLVVLKNYFLGDDGTVPVTRIGGDRDPSPLVGNFPAQGSAQGESIVAGMLELATNPIFGAGVPVERFDAAEWESLSSEVIAAVGCHSPFSDRARPLRDVLNELRGYYDGWLRIQNGKITPGRFPHDGVVPSGLTELTVHDFVRRPKVRASSPSKTINDVLIIYRDAADMLKKKPATDSASDNVEARKNHETAGVEMLGIVDASQAQRFAAEAAATGAEGAWEGDGAVRTPRATWASGDRLQAGDNVAIDLIAPQVDQVSRITKRVDPYEGSPSLEWAAEPGVYPTPYVPPAMLRPDIGKVLPNAIAQGRVYEVTPEIAGTPIGLPVGFLAMRPRSVFEGSALTSASVIGFNVYYSSTGASYELIGSTTGWGMRGTLREAIANATADVTVKLAMDADNLDLGRLASQSAQGQLNDNLLVVIGEELFSVGAITLVGLNYDLACKRVRLGSRAAAHAMDDVAWLVWRDELTVFLHKGFVEDQDRYFKLQPYTTSGTIELADIDPIVYHFRDRAPERPVIVINALPAGLTVGPAYSVTGQISDVNGDLEHYRVQAALLTGPGGAVDFAIDLQSANVAPADRALINFRSKLVFPMAGTWRIIVRADDATGAFTSAQTGELTVAVGSGGYGADDGITPDPTSDESAASHIEAILLRWTWPTNTPILQLNIYEAATAVKPANPSHVALWPLPFFLREGLAEGSTRYYWLEVVARNNRKSTVRGPFSATVVTWPRVVSIESALSAETAQREADIAAMEVLVEETAEDVLSAAEAFAAAEVAEETALRIAETAALATRATNLEATVNHGTDGVAATKARVDTIYSTFATQSYADARKAEAIAAAAADATSKVSVEAAARAGETASLAAEWVLLTTTSGGGIRRVAGMRVTNLGGASGFSEIAFQADKIIFTNDAGGNAKALLAISGGNVFINMAMIANASITKAMIASLDANQINAGELLAMILKAGYVATDFGVFNPAFGVSSTAPTSAIQTAEDGTHRTNMTGTVTIWMLTFYGWATGTGYVNDRFMRSAMKFVCWENGGCTPAGTFGSYVDLEIVYRVNGGTTLQVNPYAVRAIAGNGSLNINGALHLTGLVGSDIVQFGVRVKGGVSADQFNVANLTVMAINL